MLPIAASYQYFSILLTLGHGNIRTWVQEETGTRGYGDFGTCRHGDMGTSENGDMRTWRHEDMKTWGHEDMGR